MKKKITGLFFGTLFLLNSTYATASTATITPETIQQDLLSHFSQASNINWVKGAGFYKASFQQEGLYLQAYYSSDGTFIGVGRSLSFYQLPLILQRNVRQTYAAYWISDIREFTSTTGTSYYITFENAEEQVILKNNERNRWSVEHKTTLAFAE